jgi:diguanylate cyclase (GGDEF)-like protein
VHHVKRASFDDNWGHRQRWSVGAHLAVLLVVVLTAFVLVGAVLGRQTWKSAKQRVRVNADSLAEVGARNLADNLKAARGEVTALSTDPQIERAFGDTSGCHLDFDLEVFPQSHVDLVRPDGTISCTSAAHLRPAASHAGAAWLHAAPSTATLTGTFVDQVTGLRAVATIAVVRDPGGKVIGRVALVLPTPGTGQQLSDSFGGPRHYDYAVADRGNARLLSVSKALAHGTGAVPGANTTAATNPMGSVGFLSGSAAVPGTSWVVYSGVNPDVALASTRSVLVRGGWLMVIVMLVLLTAIAIVRRKISRPLRDLTSAVGDSGPYVDEVLRRIDGPREIVRLAAEFRAASATRAAFEAQLSHQALHDPLTGLPNRALLAEHLADAVDRADRTGGSVAVLFLDLDRFKLVNDSLGHDVGDHVLMTTAGRLRDLVPRGGTLARFGGDEFVVVLDLTGGLELAKFVDDLLAVVDDPITTPHTVVRISASIGIATSTPEYRPTDLIRDADNAMYSAKEHGRGRAEWFDVVLHDRVTARLTIASEFREALGRGELHLAYQPKVDLGTEEIIGVEALLRWDHPTLGSVVPGKFIPIAEETNAIVEVGRYVIEEACRQAMAWQVHGLDLTVAVNISGRQIAHGDLPAVVEAALRYTGLEPGRLCLELTESLLMSDTMATRRTFDRLHELGVRLSIDDFGTGYSSLAYLHRFPVDELKIDQTFVKHLPGRGQPAPLVSAMIAMGRALGLTMVAEGVETPEQAAQIFELGCDEAQGFLFARPQRAEDIAELLRPARAPVRT